MSQLVDDLYYWTDALLIWGVRVLFVWAIVDCFTRKAAAFPAADKLTKPAWLAILVFAGLIGAFLPSSPLGILSLIAVIVASVYLADVRPAVREISGGSSRW